LEIAGSREQFQLFAQTCQLKRNPDIPPALDDRAADNWRPLLAIADALGHGDKARAAAERLCAARPLDEDPAVVCLTDIRKVFDTSKRDRITSIALVLALRDLEDRPWNEWRGRHSDRAPHPLTQRELAELLSDFEIYPRTVWPLGSRRGKRSRSGYYRSQFEQAWRDYCLQSHTPTHPQKQKRIPLPKKGNREE
jgi:hypothetical protein